MIKIILVSGCLAGINCKYNGGNNYNEIVSELVKKGEAVPLCPEILGNLPVPRISCEIIKKEKLVKNAEIQGKRLLTGLVELSEKYADKITNARGKGLMCAFIVFPLRKGMS